MPSGGCPSHVRTGGCPLGAALASGRACRIRLCTLAGMMLVPFVAGHASASLPRANGSTPLAAVCQAQSTPGAMRRRVVARRVSTPGKGAFPVSVCPVGAAYAAFPAVMLCVSRPPVALWRFELLGGQRYFQLEASVGCLPRARDALLAVDPASLHVPQTRTQRRMGSTGRHPSMPLGRRMRMVCSICWATHGSGLPIRLRIRSLRPGLREPAGCVCANDVLARGWPRCPHR